MFSGQIQSHQILHLSPKTTRKTLSRLEHDKKIIEHILEMGNKKYKFYTLGPVGAKAIDTPYQPDYWFYYRDDEIIERLMAIDLYIEMCKFLSAEVKVTRADPPYRYTFTHEDKMYLIGSIWKNETSFLEIYRWTPPQERVILVCQDINQLDNLLKYFKDYTPVRAITRDRLKVGLTFYKPENGKWVLDIPEKKIKNKAPAKIVNIQRIPV